MSMPVSAGSAVWITPATSPSVMSRPAAPALRTPAMGSAWGGPPRISAGSSARPRPLGLARPVEDQRGDLGRLYALGLGEFADVLLSRRIEIDDAFRIAGTDRDLFHVDVGRVEQRARFRHGHRGDCARHVLGAQRGALERI